MTRRMLLGVLLALALLVGLQAWLVLSASPLLPVREATLLPDGARTPVDDDLELARLLAPSILHETHLELGRMDIPVALDFDGDMDARDNWEELPRYELVPTLYYTVARSATHAFITYHLYHPRDWATLSWGVHDTHEGDGASVQVVVDLATLSPVLLTAQSHYDAASYAPAPGPITIDRETLRSDFHVIQGHPSVYVDSGGHAVYGARDPRAANRLAKVGLPSITYRVAEEGETVVEPTAPCDPARYMDAERPPCADTAAYRLVSLPAFLGNSTDHPTLFGDRVVERDGLRFPRYHAGDRYSGPLGAERGMSPFTLGYGWSRSEVGALFWTPAERYQEALAIRGAWGNETLAHPFRASR